MGREHNGANVINVLDEQRALEVFEKLIDLCKTANHPRVLHVLESVQDTIRSALAQKPASPSYSPLPCFRSSNDYQPIS